MNALLPLLGVRPGEPPEGADRVAPSDDLTLTADFEQMMRALGH
ncbi:hypothetical protein PACID_26660 [Acidipropionibacterium acidipropionici ATCC 4875]|uniref:Uncharacterized protein n=1 Tax=Acidipropionibacterium acidipropionici (strain ATCC 4875 / DSM 20272 / JCM 6432 / NBRC 12425 / NCIMB 8070 / 4) TaxID=1171373 RepID=K7RZI8_ACIA4|nr:hypothetical protein PACID_26660 [Acidipropionibacterium acidipropionici ATCC 4875]